ncbi:MAG: 4-hydroxy-tetrahydrodipicolinate reductase [Clostridiales bacterium]|nr:4-hydroxy-tetrahydrodipicolinate reductase [Clostridiales bacterium]
MKILLWGACGRMGRNVTELVQNGDYEIVCGVDLCPAPMPFPVYRSAEEIKEAADAVIDFSSAQNLAERLDYCKSHHLPIVLAATGYSEADEALIASAAKSIPVFQTGNLSIGINLLQLLAKKAAEILGDAFDAEIIERHHNQKKDAPSGTALMLAKSINEGFGGEKENVYGRHGMVGTRDKREIGIHAVRGGTIVGEHEVSFAGEDEIITLSHSARSRKVFASGAIKAAKWLVSQSAGRYDMNDLLADVLN